MKFRIATNILILKNLTGALFATMVFCFVSFPSAGQSGYQFTRYTQEDGLATGSVTQITKDKTGFFWLMSEFGLVRFDGHDFKVFSNNPNDSTSIPISYFYELKEDDAGKILIRSANSLSTYLSESGTFRKIFTYTRSIRIFDWSHHSGFFFWAAAPDHLLRIDSKNESVVKFPLPQDFNRTEMKILVNDPNSVWLVNKWNQLIRFDVNENKFATVKLVNSDSKFSSLKNIPKEIFTDEKGNTCMLTGNGLFLYDPARHIFVQYSSSRCSKNENENYQGNAVLASGYLFIGNNNSDLIRIRISDGSEKYYHLNNSVATAENPVFAFNNLCSSRDGSIWISTTTAGAYHFFPTSETWEQLVYDEKNQNSLLSNSTDFILADEHNLVWINCAGRGIVKAEWVKPVLTPYMPVFINKNPTRVMTENVRTLFSLDKEHLLVGSLGGLLLFNTVSHDFKPYKSPTGEPVLPNTAVSNIIKDKKGNLWISEWGRVGIYVLNFQNKKFTKLIPDSTMSMQTTIRALFCDSQNYLWAGTDGDALYRADLDSLDIEHPEKLKFKKYSGAMASPAQGRFTMCFVISEDKNGRVLFGMQNGFYVYDYALEKFKRFTKEPRNSKSISDDNIRSLCVDHSGRIWLGTNSGGLNSLDESTQTFTSYTIKNGLPDNTIYSVLEDNKGFLWLGTNKGLCRFNPVTNSCRNYSMKDGIQNYEFNTNASGKTADGELAFGGRTGFNFFNPDSIEISSGAPPVVLTKFQVFDHEIPLDNKPIKLKYNENSISFQFAALSYFRNKENKFAYKLEGLDKEWIYCGDRRFTNYANLPPGDYTFRVKASNCYGVWNEAGVELSLFVGTPWWNSWWFRLLVLLTISGMIFALFRYRLRQKLKFQDVRNKIARDLHDEIGSNLSSISLFSEVAKSKARDSSGAVTPLLKKISEYTQVSQEAMNDIVWMINARNDNFENIIVRMRALAAELFEAKSVTLHLNFDEKLNNIRMEMEKRKNFYLIYKESVNNIVKYAECKNVWIDLENNKSSVVLRIKDDGKGFDPKINFHGNGLVNMKKRSEALNGQLIILSDTGKGTTVELKFGS